MFAFIEIVYYLAYELENFNRLLLQIKITGFLVLFLTKTGRYGLKCLPLIYHSLQFHFICIHFICIEVIFQICYWK